MNKGIARAAKERRRAEAEARNARTPDDRRRVSREGSVEYRAKRPTPPAASALAPAPAEPEKPRVRRGVVLAAPKPRHVPAPADAEQVRARRKAAHLRRTTKGAARWTRPSDIAPRRITDGIKPNHEERAISLAELWPDAPKHTAPPAEPAKTEQETTQ